MDPDARARWPFPTTPTPTPDDTRPRWPFTTPPPGSPGSDASPDQGGTPRQPPALPPDEAAKVAAGLVSSYRYDWARKRWVPVPLVSPTPPVRDPERQHPAAAPMGLGSARDAVQSPAPRPSPDATSLAAAWAVRHPMG